MSTSRKVVTLYPFRTLFQFSVLFKSKLMENKVEMTFMEIYQLVKFTIQYPFFFYLIGRRFDQLTEKNGVTWCCSSCFCDPFQW